MAMKHADTLADALDLDPTEAALAAADEARAALDADLAATISAATDLVADCRLALAVGTAWHPRFPGDA